MLRWYSKFFHTSDVPLSYQRPEGRLNWVFLSLVLTVVTLCPFPLTFIATPV